MTRIGKCDICRIRKVKVSFLAQCSRSPLTRQCDEKHPKCGQCMKKNRPCSYDYRTTPKFVPGKTRGLDIGNNNTEFDDSSNSSPEPDVSAIYDVPFEPAANKTILSIRSVKGAKTGQGAFHTLTSIRLTDDLDPDSETDSVPTKRTNRKSAYSIIRSPISSKASLCARLVELLGTKPLQWNPSFLWGSWVTIVPQRIGINPALDSAVACFIAGSAAHRNKSETNLSAARKSYSRALLSLQEVLTGPEDQKLSSETLAAVKLLTAFEVRKMVAR